MKDWRTAWYTLLNNYFDGGSHSFGGSAITFPDCDVSFDRPQFGAALTKPLINVMGMRGDSITRKAKPGGGFRRIAEIPTVVSVFTADKADIWDANYNVQDLLEVVLSGAADELHALGVKVVDVGYPTALTWGPSHDMQATHRILQTRVSVNYPAGD